MTLPWGSSRFDQAAAHVVAPSGGGAIQLTVASPNDWTTGAWTTVGSPSRTYPGFTDPLGGSNASEIVCTSSTFTSMSAPTTPSTLTAGTVYSLTGYVKSVVAPVWCAVGIVAGSDQFLNFINASTGAVGSPFIAGGGHVDTFAAPTSQPNGFWKFVITGHFTGTVSSATAYMWFAAADNGNSGTTSQAADFWGWGT